MIKKQDDYDNKNVYIGSCCNFSRRKCEHKRTCNNPIYQNHNVKVYKYIRENDGWDCWIMTKIIDYPCNSKSELKIMERKYIDEYKSILNCTIPTRTDAEWRNDNKEHISKHMKQYYQDNKDRKLIYNKQYYNDNCDKLKKQTKEYRINNEEKFKEKVICDNCGSIVSKEHLRKHIKTLKCINFVKRQEYNQDNKDKIVKCDNCGCYSDKRHLTRHKKSLKCINFVTK